MQQATRSRAFLGKNRLSLSFLHLHFSNCHPGHLVAHARPASLPPPARRRRPGTGTPPPPFLTESPLAEGPQEKDVSGGARFDACGSTPQPGGAGAGQPLSAREQGRSTGRRPPCVRVELPARRRARGRRGLGKQQQGGSSGDARIRGLGKQQQSLMREKSGRGGRRRARGRRGLECRA
jgi:hypothetical protein